jgi:hypothetical protein
MVFANLTAVMTELITASSQSNNDIIQLIPKIEEAEILTRYETMEASGEFSYSTIGITTKLCPHKTWRQSVLPKIR